MSRSLLESLGAKQPITALEEERNALEKVAGKYKEEKAELMQLLVESVKRKRSETGAIPLSTALPAETFQKPSALYAKLSLSFVEDEIYATVLGELRKLVSELLRGDLDLKFVTLKGPVVIGKATKARMAISTVVAERLMNG